MSSNIFDRLTRGVPGVSPRQMTAPATSFYSQQEIMGAQPLRYTRDKLFLGVIGADIERDRATGERYAQGGQAIGVADDRHVITVAGSRAGKGRAAIIPNLLCYGGSVLAIDPKGELATFTARSRAKGKQRVYVVDPFGEAKGEACAYASGFNPMDMMRDKSLIEDAALIADALVLSEEKEPHWSESARTIIEGVILEVATADRFEGRRNLVTVRDLIGMGDSFTDPDTGETATGMAELEEQMRASASDMVRRAAADFFDREDKERGSVLSTARRHLRALSFPEIAASLEGESFDLAELKTGKTTVYLCLPGRHIGTCGRWLRLFVNLALQAMERNSEPPAAGAPVLFVLDEFASLGHMRQIEDAAGQIAGYGVKLWPILQDLGQLKALYQNRWETFMGNAGVLQFFGNNDLTTLEWISKRLGSTTIEQLSASDTTPAARGAGATGESYAPRTVRVMEPEEVATVFGRNDRLCRQLVMLAGYGAMILQRAYYDKHQIFGW